MYAGLKVWQIAAQDLELQDNLSFKLQIPPVIAQILINRGITSPEEAEAFLFHTLADLSDPWELPDMTRAVERIMRALQLGERILVYGDYDVDGITSTALLTSVLHRLGGQVSYYIPERLEEGYGLNKSALDWLKKEVQADLIITVDCGIVSCEEVAYANRLGIDIIVTDHHQPGLEIPPAVAVINPKVAPSSRLQNLAGVGVAFKLAQALYKVKSLPPVNGTLAGDTLDLVVLGTIADVVPLTGENRIIVKYGLPSLTASQRPGIKALMQVAGLEGKLLTTGQVAFGLAPRLNAAGRLGSAAPAVELLLTTSEQRAWELANKLNRENEERQLVETQIYREVCARVEKEIDLTKEKVIVLASSLWHAGVIGIVASKITERYYRPSILMSIEGDKAKGSGRSISGFNLFKALQSCEQLLLKYGGHHQAAGMSLAVENIPRFKDMLNEYADEVLTSDKLTPILTIDAELRLEQINAELYKQLEKLEPYGTGNPEPILCCRGVKLAEYRVVGKNGNHLKAKLIDKNQEMDAIGFNLAPLLNNFQVGMTKPVVDAAFTLSENEWNGRSKLQLLLKDLQRLEPVPREFTKLNGYIAAFLDKLLANARLGIICIIKAPLRRICTGLADFLQRHMLMYGLQVIKVDGQNITHHVNPESLIGKVIVTTEAAWQKLQAIFPQRCVEIFDYACFFSEASYRPNIYDERGTEKTKRLAEMVDSGEKIVVYFNYREAAFDQAERLVRLYPSFQDKIKVFFGNETLTEHFTFKDSQVVFTNQFLEFYNWPEITARVFFEPPFSLEEFYLRTYSAHTSPVYLLWNDEDVVTNEEVLKAMFPDRIFLMNLVRVLKTLPNGQPLNILYLAQQLNLPLKRLGIIKLTSGLKILSELKKIYRKDKAYYPLDIAGEVELEQSAYFTEGQIEFAALVAFNNSAFPWEATMGVG
ncbi:single-stranded-DNA-specific exonuclease RecJ [Zhaonella formicivorans]|uniref:single-stranded-DNA-specific exonuclease RecJ n=1 Tax=Zhaonella formicivorans TaxID=2528593 RepID=UPI0010D863FE|nr:single-stranded-DNA-specific exonuclease RecJ [Zhaonella formicivorans]